MPIKVHCKHDKLVMVKDLKPNPENPNKHPEKQIDLLAEMIKAQGWRTPITVSNRSGFIVRGHGRYYAALALAEKKAPVDFQDYESDEEEWADLLADNKIAELAEKDEDLLTKLLSKVDDSDLEIELTGYTQVELDRMIEKQNRREAEKPEVEFSEELMESSNYVVLYFNNDVDWLQALTLFELETVKALDSKEGFTKQGIGRVLNGPAALNRILNHILDTEFKKKVDAVAILDDDVQYFGYHQNKKRIKMDPDYFREWLVKHTLIAREWGVKVWGVNLNQDKQSYREYTPFSLTSVILGPFMVHLPHDVRFDERFPTKDDYDFSIQMLNRHRRILRLNKFFYVNKMAGSGSGQTGGHARIRNMHNEMVQVVGLQKKWGPRIIRLDSGKSRSHSTKKTQNFDINPIVSVPIRGV